MRKGRTNLPPLLGAIQARDNLSRFPAIAPFATEAQQRRMNAENCGGQIHRRFCPING
jgi:hypothetical protein